MAVARQRGRPSRIAAAQDVTMDAQLLIDLTTTIMQQMQQAFQRCQKLRGEMAEATRRMKS